MSKKTLIQADNRLFSVIKTDNLKQSSTFRQARNKLIESAKKHVKTNGLTNNILGVLSQNSYTQEKPWNGSGNGLLGGRRGLTKTLAPSNLAPSNLAPNGSASIHKRTQLFSTRVKSATAHKSPTAIKTIIPSQTITKVDIFTTGATESTAKTLATALTNCGICANLFNRNINNADIAVCLREHGRYLFIFSPQLFLQAKNGPTYPGNLTPLPANKYFLYQTENLRNKSPRNLNLNILELIKYARHTFDHSHTNIHYYPVDCSGRVSVLTSQNSLDTMKRYLTIRMLYPVLFHKYILGLRNPDENLIKRQYSVVSTAPITRKNICHIHCFYLKFLDSMFAKYISLINQTFDIIVTYTHADDVLLTKYNNITFLQVTNYGMDIGPKFTVRDYLLSKNVNYNYIFYIHSKTDNERRNKYLLPFIKNFNTIQQKIDEQATSNCYFNNVILNGDEGNDYKWSKYNLLYMNEILNYLKIKTFKNDTQFEEGNFYILNKKIVDILFSDKLLYNILNENNCFDYNWVCCFYELTNNNNNTDIRHINDVYGKYINRKLYGNNITTQRGHAGLADGMVEHIFERLPILLCKEYGIKYNILS
jgi:hypothetical protein